jgi:uncharacterized protein (TIGR03435 family)
MGLPLLLAAMCYLAQTASTTPTFAVTSVRRNTSGNNSIGNQFGPGSIRWMNTPLETLVEQTYGVHDYQVIGAPAWMLSDRWDIEAKSDGPADFRAKREMMASLLRDRFQLQFHRETRQLPISRIEIAKGGPKLAAAQPETPDHRWGTTVDRGLLEMRGTDMQNLVSFLMAQLNRPFVDATNLKGVYDLKLQWQDDLTPEANAEGLSLMSAVELHLGLKLVAAKGPVEVIVIDHVERAEAN